MHAQDRDPKCARVQCVSIAAIVAASLLTLVGAAGAHAAMIKKCPTANSLRAAAGTPLTIGTHKAGMDVFCDYTHPLSATLKDSVSIAVEPLRESDAAFERSAKAFAKDLKAHFKQLSGVGDEAWESTEPKSKLDAGGLPTTTVTIVVGRREVTVISNLAAKNVLDVAKHVS
ncbi:MAG TPA: hypothetical protein VGL69_01915 [Solirubrobacteraceae bacterium]|jgi:hypothetical protein